MSDWLTWQIVDSAFPTGAFAHSSGLESAWQHGEVRDAAGLGAFVHGALLQTGYGVLPLLNAAYRSPERFDALDARADTFLLNAVANRASRIQGRSLLMTALRVWPSAALKDASQQAATSCAHVAPLSGVVFRIVGLPLVTAQKVCLFGNVRLVLAASVRLGIVGAYEAQRLQAGCGPWLDQVLERCGALGDDALAQTMPVVDILQARHDLLYSRLFQS